MTVTVATGSFVYGMINAGDAGWAELGTLLPIAAAIVLYAGFVVVERTVPTPLLRLSLLARRPIATGAFLMLVAAGVLIAGLFLGSQYLQHLRGLSALETGLFFLPAALALMSGAITAGRLVGRIGTRPVAVVALALAAIGNGLLIGVSADGNVYAEALPGVTVFALGGGPLFVCATTAASAASACTRPGWYRAARPSLPISSYDPQGPEGESPDRASHPVGFRNLAGCAEQQERRHGTIRRWPVLPLPQDRRLLGMLLGSARSEHAKDVEIVVLRPPARGAVPPVQRPGLRPADRALLAALSAALLAGAGRASLSPRTRSCGAPSTGDPHMDAGPSSRRAPATGQRRGRADPAAGPSEPAVGDQRIHGELRQLRISVSATTIPTVLLRNGLRPASRRASVSWRAFLRAQASAIVAVDVFTV